MGSIRLSIPALDDVTEFTLKTRCKRCWGSVRGRTDAEHRITGIKCLVCGRSIEGQPAADEEERISKESFANAVNADWGLNAKYGDGTFAQKVFPELERLSEQELMKRVALSKGQYAKSPKGRLTRHEFPAGSPGWLFLQARALIDWVGEETDHERDSIAEFPDYDLNPDGSVSVRIDMDGVSEDPKHREHALLKRAGSLLGNGMIAAFACEIAMKCIAITCGDETVRTHDLLGLFDHLPEESQNRILADYATARDVLSANRGVFGAWRYFEAAVGADAFTSMADPDSSRSLAKAARVILDEAEFVGLTASLKLQAKRNIRVTGEKRQHADNIEITIRGGERPPRK